MPIYEYECHKCRCRFEIKQSYDAESTAVCSACGGQARRILQPAPVHFKGSGFYVTDSRKAKPETETPKKETPKKPEASAGEKSKGKQ